MKRTRWFGWLAVLAMPAVTAQAATRYTLFVEEGAGFTERDGPVYGAGGAFVEPNGTIGFSGRFNGAPMYMVSKFKLSNFLPGGTTAADIGKAYLFVPYTDTAWVIGPDPAWTTMDLVLHHFATTNDTTIVSADHSDVTPPLTDYGIVIPRHVRTGQFASRKVIVDVTNSVKNDLANGRALSSFRVGADPAGPLGTNDYTYFATADNNDTFFDLAQPGAPEDDEANRNVLRLVVFVGTPEICDNGIDDDNDCLIDCDDKDECDDFQLSEPCHETLCSDALDNDHDGRTDCEDSDCFGKPGCTTETICNDGQNNDSQGGADCADPDCFGQPGCLIETICNDNQDNDGDGLVDCADPDDCFGRTGCTVEGVGNNNSCTDGKDNDFDCLVDGADPDCASQGVQPVPKPLSAQDDSYIVALNAFQGSTSPFWTYGQYNCQPWVAIGMITFPAGTTSAQVGKAILQLPNNDVLWNVEPANSNASVSAMNLLALHIDAADDTQVTAADATSTPLGTLGVYRPPGPRAQSTAGQTKVTKLDVTTQVKADLDAGRATFAFRIEYESTPSVCDVASYYSPSVDSTDGFFPAGQRGARLFLLLPGTFESSCTNGTDDDGDGAIDCNDADCYGTPDCSGVGKPEVCRNLIDDDGDGLTDCNDPDCAAFPCCLPAETGPVLCANGLDDDLDGKVDCLDRGCANQPNCREGGSPLVGAMCRDGLDNDGDGRTDCADPDCWSFSLCRIGRPWADFDGDGDVDLADFARWQICQSGANPYPPCGCVRFDRNLNGSVDANDFEEFMDCATRAGVALDVNNPPAGCAP